jgi:hypothetical protein
LIGTVALEPLLKVLAMPGNTASCPDLATNMVWLGTPIASIV